MSNGLFSRLLGPTAWIEGQKKARLSPGLRIQQLRSVAHIGLQATGGQFHLDDLSTLFHDPLLLSEPAVVGNPLGEVGVLNLPLGPDFFRAGDASSDFKETHSAPWMSRS